MASPMIFLYPIIISPRPKIGDLKIMEKVLIWFTTGVSNTRPTRGSIRKNKDFYGNVKSFRLFFQIN